MPKEKNHTKTGFIISLKKFSPDLAFLKLQLLSEKNIEPQILQYVIKNKQIIEGPFKNLSRGSYVKCTGTSEDPSKLKSQTKSFELKKITVINYCDNVPSVDFSKKKINTIESAKDNSQMLKNPSNSRLLQLLNVIYDEIRVYMKKKGYTQILTPKLVSFGSEGGSEIFKVEGLQKKGFLVQSPQLFKQLAITMGLKKVYQIGPIFRAQKYKTTRHLNEAICLDVQMQCTRLKTLYDLITSMIVRISGKLNSIDPTLKKYTKEDFGFMTYKEAVKLLNNDIDQDLTSEDEFALIKHAKKQFLFITGYPLNQRAFYTHKTTGFDLLSKRCQICSGAQRENSPKILEKQIKSRGIEPSDFGIYMDSFRNGAPKSMGFGLGLDRLIMVLLDLPNIASVKLFKSEL
jgi:aspartyl/asparaginyl-tRNA synthetase